MDVGAEGGSLERMGKLLDQRIRTAFELLERRYAPRTLATRHDLERVQKELTQLLARQKPPPFSPDPADLPRAAPHVAYELRMFRRLAPLAETEIGQRAPRTNDNDLDQLNYLARIGAFALHFRNVAEFLSSAPSAADTVLAMHYYPGWTPPRFSEFLTKQIQRAHKFAAHLSYARIRYQDLGAEWLGREILREMQPHVARFKAETSAAEASRQMPPLDRRLSAELANW